MSSVPRAVVRHTKLGRKSVAAGLEVSFTVDGLDGPWTAPVILRRRRRRVTAPAPRAQLLARVAAVDAHGTQSAWSPPILVTAG